MKNAKKLLALLMATLMLIAVCVPAFAAGSSSDTDEPEGSITITNADIGQTYSYYKAFDISYSTTADGKKTVQYYTNNPALLNLIKNSTVVPADKTATYATYEAYYKDYEPAYAAGDNNKYVPTNPICPFVIGNEVDGNPGYYYITHINVDVPAPGAGWLSKNLDDWKEWGATTFNGKEYAAGEADNGSKVADSYTVEFTPVEYGYYLITTSAGSIVTVDKTTPNAVVVDKNTKSPSEPTKTADKVTVEGGEEVTFTSTLLATNYLTGGITNINAIDEYQLNDYWDAGLTFDFTNLDSSIVSVKVYPMVQDEDGKYIIDTIKEATTLTRVEEANAATAGEGKYWIESTTVDGKNGFVMHFPWASMTKTPVEGSTTGENTYTLNEFYYSSPSRIEVVYKMTVNDAIYDKQLDYSATNTAKYTYDHFSDGTTTHKEGDGGKTPVDTTVHSFGLSLRKIDDKTSNASTLPGAEFIVYRMDQKTVSASTKTIEYYLNGDEYYLVDQPEPEAYSGEITGMKPVFTADDDVEYYQDGADYYTVAKSPVTRSGDDLTIKEGAYTTEGYLIYTDISGVEYYLDGDQIYKSVIPQHIKAEPSPVNPQAKSEVGGFVYILLDTDEMYYLAGDSKYYPVETVPTVYDGDKNLLTMTDRTHKVDNTDYIIYELTVSDESASGEEYKVYTDGTKEIYLVPGDQKAEPATTDAYYEVETGKPYTPAANAKITPVWLESTKEYYQLQEAKSYTYKGTDYLVYADKHGKEYYLNGGKYYALESYTDTDVKAEDVEKYMIDATFTTKSGTVIDLYADESGNLYYFDESTHYEGLTEGGSWWTYKEGSTSTKLDPTANEELITDLDAKKTNGTKAQVQGQIVIKGIEYKLYKDTDGDVYYLDHKGTAVETDDTYKLIVPPVELTDTETISDLKQVFTNKVIEYTSSTVDLGQGRNYVAKWVTSRDDATRVSADNSYATMDVIGISEGTYFIEEVKAPAGYNLPAKPFVVTITATYDDDGDTCTWSVDPDKNGNTEGITKDTSRNYAYTTMIIQNGTTKEMPTTGGAGTVALIGFGALAFLGTGVVLVAKKRVYNEG